MEKIARELTLVAGKLSTDKVRIVFFALTVVLFAIGAAAPEDIGIFPR